MVFFLGSQQEGGPTSQIFHMYAFLCTVFNLPKISAGKYHLSQNLGMN